jgi:hypothetical protein
MENKIAEKIVGNKMILSAYKYSWLIPKTADTCNSPNKSKGFGIKKSFIFGIEL